MRPEYRKRRKNRRLKQPKAAGIERKARSTQALLKKLLQETQLRETRLDQRFPKETLIKSAPSMGP
ncbi:MAG: hypothetical protein WBP89_01265, partial [Sedimenticolaceae bacterium]